MSLRTIRLGSLDQAVSALGFGCASLGSRVGSAAGLSALERAFDAGVTWFDVAPAYGDGQAEVLLGQFLRGRRDQVQILTKVGLAPPKPSLNQRVVRPAIRFALAVMPGLRAQVRKRRPTNTRVPLDAASIAASLDASLKRMGVDHVDVLALHGATPEESGREDVIRALERVVTSGKARTVAIASSPEAAAAGLGAWPGYGLAQFASNPLEPGLEQVKALLPSRPFDAVTHTVYGNEGQIGVLAQRIELESGLRLALGQAGYGGEPKAIAADVLADYAFAANPDGVVLMSMFSARHLAANVARHALPRDPQAILALGWLIAASPVGVT